MELFAHAAALKDKYALEKQELILRRKKEQLELKTEIAATTAKLAVLQLRNSITSKHASVTSLQSDGMESYFRKRAKSKLQPTSRNVHALKFMPQSSKQHASFSTRHSLTTALVSLNAQQCSAIAENITVTPTQHVVISTSLPPHLGS